MSASDDAAPIAELVDRFCKENSLPDVSEQWPNNLIHPSEALGDNQSLDFDSKKPTTQLNR